MRLLILGRDIPLTDSDRNEMSTKHSKIACREPLNNKYEENCSKNKNCSSHLKTTLKEDNLHKTEETEVGVKPKLRGPVV